MFRVRGREKWLHPLPKPEVTHRHEAGESAIGGTHSHPTHISTFIHTNYTLTVQRQRSRTLSFSQTHSHKLAASYYTRHFLNVPVFQRAFPWLTVFIMSYRRMNYRKNSLWARTQNDTLSVSDSLDLLIPGEIEPEGSLQRGWPEHIMKTTGKRLRNINGPKDHNNIMSHCAFM